MANWDNSRWTYEQVLAGTSYYRTDDQYRYSEGVHILQINLNVVGYNCGTPDGKFGSGTESAVKNFQEAKGLIADGLAGATTLNALESMAAINYWNNALWTYTDVRVGRGYYAQDENLRNSAGVASIQAHLNELGYNCGSADGKFGPSTTAAVKRYQVAKGLTVDGRITKKFLEKLDGYSVNVNNNNENAVYSTLVAAGLSKVAIAAIMGNIEVESRFKTELSGHDGSGGICQWNGSRLTNLKSFANSRGKEATDIFLQAEFLLEECRSSYPTLLPLLQGFENKLSNVEHATDVFIAIFERSHHHATMSEVMACGLYDSKRFPQVANYYDNMLYIDSDDRRGYALAFYKAIS